jgi:hypothetical protein
MSQIHVEYSAVIDGQPEEIYAVIRDYHIGHRAILPKPYFTGLEVEKGGVGAGTVILVHMEVFGNKRTYRHVVTEPEPNRLLIEQDDNLGVMSRFRVEPVNEHQTRVTIIADSRPQPGFTGLMEKLFNPPIMRKIFREELQLLAEYVRDKRPVSQVN